MKTVVRFVIIAGVMVIIFQIAFTHRLYAQETTLSLSPASAEVIIAPGKSATITYTVENGGDPVIVMPRIVTFRPKDIYGGIGINFRDRQPSEFSLENPDVHFLKSFLLKDGEKRDLTIQLLFPPEAELKDYYYVFLVETEPPQEKEGAISIPISSSVGAPLLVSLAQNSSPTSLVSLTALTAKSRLQIPWFGKTIYLIESTDPIEVNLVAENRGDFRTKPSGTISIKGGFSKNLTYEIIPTNILSRSRRLLFTTASPTGALAASSKTNGFFMGSYNIIASLKNNPKTAGAKRTITIIAFPFKLIFALIIGIIVGMILYRRIKTTDVTT